MQVVEDLPLGISFDRRNRRYVIASPPYKNILDRTKAEPSNLEEVKCAAQEYELDTASVDYTMNFLARSAFRGGATSFASKSP